MPQRKTSKLTREMLRHVQSRFSTAHQGPKAADDFVVDLLEWCREHGQTGWRSWRQVRTLARKFAIATGHDAISDMSLSKALKAAGVPKRWRYMKPDEPEFRVQVERGHRRPRQLVFCLVDDEQR
ncbi:MAG: hypothetical protein R3D27_03410 [Hyphomicrobiaceae bacterium]